MTSACSCAQARMSHSPVTEVKCPHHILLSATVKDICGVSSQCHRRHPLSRTISTCTCSSSASLSSLLSLYEVVAIRCCGDYHCCCLFVCSPGAHVCCMQALDEDQPGSKVMFKKLFEEDREYNQGMT